MTAPIVTHYKRIVLTHTADSITADMARATIRRQQIEALPKVEGQLWTRLAEVAR